MTESSENPPADFELMLVEAGAEARHGRLEVASGGKPAGSVVFSRGRVAWATCASQTETLGRFLERLGHVNADQLRAASSEYARHAGCKKLGRLLEDMGLITRPLLRRCLLLHVRLAIAGLLGLPDCTAIWHDADPQEEEDLSFPLHQVVPDCFGLPVDEAVAAVGAATGDPSALLLTFNEVPGYRGSLVVDWIGRTVARHGFFGNAAGEAGWVAATAVNLLQESARGAGSERFGEPVQALLEASDGTLVARWLDSGHQLLLALALDHSGKAGTALHRLAGAAPAILSSLRRGQEGRS